MNAYSGSNENIKNIFFPEIPSDTPLFPPPTENDVLDLNPIEKLERDVSMLTKIVYSLAKKLNQEPLKIPSNQDINPPLRGNSTGAQIIGMIAIPGSKVLKDALSNQWYSEQNPDVRKAGFDPYWHWHDFGMKEGRLPAPDLAKLMAELMAERNTISRQDSGPVQAEAQPTNRLSNQPKP
jgi:hypothetical protein